MDFWREGVWAGATASVKALRCGGHLEKLRERVEWGGELGLWVGGRWHGAVVAQRNRYQCSVGPGGCASWALPISPGSLLHPYQLFLAAARILGAGVAGRGGVGGSGRTELELPGGTAQLLLLGCFARQPAAIFGILAAEPR